MIERTERLTYVDMVRGIAILLVIAGHLISKNCYNSEGGSGAVMFINSFHVPIFFAISGFISQKVYKPLVSLKDVGNFIVKKAKLLLIPLFMWDLIVYNYFLRNSWKLLSFDDLVNEVVQPKLWFLMTLFLLFVSYSFFSYLNYKFNERKLFIRDIVILLVVSCLCLLYYAAHLEVQRVLLYTPYFYMGVLISKYDFIWNLVFNDYVFCISFFLFCMLVGHWDSRSGTNIYDIIKNIVDPCAFIVILNVCKKYESIKVSKIISKWGRYSLEIYVAHWCLISICSMWSLNLSNVNEIWLFLLAIVLSVPIVYSCIGLAKIIEVSPVTRLIIYGRM